MKAITKDYYAILGLAHSAEDVVIRAMFKLMAHRYHPDKWQSEKDYANRMMTDINEAYRHLAKHDNLSRISADHYQCLGLLPQADAQMIQVAYEALTQKYHADPRMLSRLGEAYQTLADAKKRTGYDRQRMRPVAPARTSGRLNLWKIYLAYNAGVYIVMAIIVGLFMFL